MAQPGTQPMGNQCQYILSCNASNTDNGNLQPDNKYATSLVYVTMLTATTTHINTSQCISNYKILTTLISSCIISITLQVYNNRCRVFRSTT
jgi:hypothetical protein